MATVVEVTDQPPVVETERGSQADTITQQYIADLPVDRRDYLTFTLLAPGVSDSTRLAGDQDFRVKQTPQSGLSFYGSNGRGNSITVDGGETSGDSGGQRLTVSQDTVQEFQINRSNYAADLGSATGASINIVTKSGANNVHGTLYGFFRDDALDAANPFSFSQALQAGQTFNPANPDSVGSPVKGNSTGHGPSRRRDGYFQHAAGVHLRLPRAPGPIRGALFILRQALKRALPFVEGAAAISLGFARAFSGLLWCARNSRSSTPLLIPFGNEKLRSG